MGWNMPPTFFEKSNTKEDTIYNICHIDADSLLHKVANMTEEKYIEATLNETGSTREFKGVTGFYGTKKDRSGGWLGEFNTKRINKNKEPYKVEDFTIVQKARIKPYDKETKEGFKTKGDAVKFAIELFTMKIHSIRSKMKSKDYILYIGGVGNYRKDIAKIKQYKGHRPPKPILFKEIEAEIKSKYSSKIVVCDGEESEDVISIIMQGNRSNFLETGVWKDIFAYIDKDLEMIHSPRINYDKLDDGIYVPTFGECQKHFLKQLLMGDSVDNIQGLPTLSREFREKYNLRNTKGNTVGKSVANSLVESGEDLKHSLQLVLEAYKDCYGEDDVTFKSWEEDTFIYNYVDFLTENARLLWMRVSEGEIWDLETYCKFIGVDIKEVIGVS